MNQHDTHDGQDGREHDNHTRTEKPIPRRNPRLVIGTLDYFDMLMEQDEEG